LNNKTNLIIILPIQNKQDRPRPVSGVAVWHCGSGGYYCLIVTLVIIIITGLVVVVFARLFWIL
jgi:hypothetical protein